MTLKKHVLMFLLLLSSAWVMAQDRVVTGKVVSAKTNKGLAGASVLIKGTNRGTSTDDNGSFSISVPSGAQTLVISSVEAGTKEVRVAAGETMVAVSMEEGNGQLGEVVVTALGISREKKTLVYATQTVKAAELTEARDPNNVINSLNGKVANAVITQGSGGPGSGARVVLRGNRSIQGSNNALIVVDGVPLVNNTNGTASSDFGSVQGSDGASSINPDDIENVTVLRGASAAALYGNQAGNGVILITTKKGRKDRIAVTLNSGVAVESPFALPEFQNTYGQGNGGVLSSTSGESWGAKMDGQSYTNFLGKQANYSPQPDNVKDFFRRGVSFNNSVGVTGGTDKMQTYLSYTNNNIKGIIPGNDMNRHTVNLRVSNQIGKRFSTDGKLTYVYQDIRNRPRTGEENAPVIDIYNMARNIPLSDAKQSEFINNVGIPTPTPFPSTLSSIYQNPYWLLNRTSINEIRDRVIGFLSAKYKIFDWLSLSGRANLDQIFDRGDNSVSQGTILWGKTGGDFGKSQINTTQLWFDAMLEGNNKITNDLKINYRVGGIFQDNKYDGNFQNANGLNITNKFSLNFASAPSVSSSFTQHQTQSLFGQANVSFRDYLFLDVSYRNDWDSYLPKPYTYQYPSVGLSAILSDMLKMPEPISFLKLSANYAEVGNGGQFALLNTRYNYSQGAGNGYLQRGGTLPFPNLKPEIIKSYEFGAEARFFNNKVGFTATYYKSNSYNQLLSLPLVVASGYSSQYINAGNIQNSGVEFVVNGTPIQNRDFKWDVTFNLALNRSKVVELSKDLKQVALGGGYGRSATPLVQEGKPFGEMVGLKWARDAKGQFIVDANGKPTITSDNQSIGNINPKATLGLTNTFEYKGLYVRVLIDGRVGGTMVSGTELNLAFSGIPKATEKYREGGWNLGGVDANGQAVSAAISAQDFWQIASGKRYGVADFFAYDVTNFRVRELSLGYGLPIKNTNIVKAARLSFVARNLLWLYRGDSKLNIPGLGTRRMWFDPDMSLGNGNYQGIEYGTLPATRSLGLNLQVTF